MLLLVIPGSCWDLSLSAKPTPTHPNQDIGPATGSADFKSVLKDICSLPVPWKKGRRSAVIDACGQLNVGFERTSRVQDDSKTYRPQLAADRHVTRRNRQRKGKGYVRGPSEITGSQGHESKRPFGDTFDIGS